VTDPLVGALPLRHSEGIFFPTSTDKRINCAYKLSFILNDVKLMVLDLRLKL